MAATESATTRMTAPTTDPAGALAAASARPNTRDDDGVRA